jgi:tetratricopeptide (TPR) repeat protein
LTLVFGVQYTGRVSANAEGPPSGGRHTHHLKVWGHRMRTHSRTVLLAVVLAIAGLGASSCSKIGMLKGQMAWKDANAAYAASDYKKAIEKYQEALKNNPELSYAYFYLGNSYDNLYKVAKKGQPENDANLQKAVENYKLATEKITEPKLRKLSFEYLLNSYGPDKLNDPSQAEPIVQKMIEMDPSDTANYFALAKIYEDAGNYEQAEAALLKARDASTRRWMP